MADPTAFYEPEEDELLSSLAVPAYQNQEGQYDDEYRRLQELEQHAYAQQIAAAQEQEQEQGQLLELVPDDVKKVSAVERSVLRHLWRVGGVRTRWLGAGCVHYQHAILVPFEKIRRKRMRKRDGWCDFGRRFVETWMELKKRS